MLQMIKETGQREVAMPRDQMLTIKTIVRKVNITDTATFIKLVKVCNKVCLAGSHMGRIKGQKQVVVADKTDHVTG